MTGCTVGSFSRCTSPGKQPTSSLKTYLYSSIRSTLFSSAVTWRIFSLFTVMRFICWHAFAPNTGIKSSATTVNRTAYLFSLVGFTILTLHSPSGVFNYLSHICSIFVDGVNSAAGTWRAEMRFTDAPQSSWSFTSSRPMRILAKSSRFVGVSSR